jgi:hypothetical protein
MARAVEPGHGQYLSGYGSERGYRRGAYGSESAGDYGRNYGYRGEYGRGPGHGGYSAQPYGRTYYGHPYGEQGRPTAGEETGLRSRTMGMGSW